MKNNTYKKYKNSYRWNSFSHYNASWASNHRGWSKMKKRIKRIAKRREARENNKKYKEEV